MKQKQERKNNYHKWGFIMRKIILVITALPFLAFSQTPPVDDGFIYSGGKKVGRLYLHVPSLKRDAENKDIITIWVKQDYSKESQQDKTLKPYKIVSRTSNYKVNCNTKEYIGLRDILYNKAGLMVGDSMYHDIGEEPPETPTKWQASVPGSIVAHDIEFACAYKPSSI